MNEEKTPWRAFYLPALCLVPCLILVISVSLKLVSFFVPWDIALSWYSHILYHFSFSFGCLAVIQIHFSMACHAPALPSLWQSVLLSHSSDPARILSITPTSAEPAVSWVVLADQTRSRSVLFLVAVSTKCNICKGLEAGGSCEHLRKWRKACAAGMGRLRGQQWSNVTMETLSLAAPLCA